MKNKKGITLIALVITIIILLILAGVALSQLTGNGLFGKVKQAKEEQLKSKLREEIELVLYQCKMMEQQNTTFNIKELLEKEVKNSVVNQIEKEGYNKTGNNGYYSISRNGYSYDIYDLEIIGEALKIGDNKEQIKMDASLQQWLNATREEITIEDILTNKQMQQPMGLIPVLTADSVTRKEEDSIIKYIDSTGGITTSASAYESQYNGGFSYLAFNDNWEDDSGVSNVALSDMNAATDYWLSYEFPEKVKAIYAKLRISNASYTVGQRKIKLQAFNENTNLWENLTEEILYEGNLETFPIDILPINSEKTYKKYRVYVISIGNSTGAATHCSGIYGLQLYGIKTEDDSISREEITKRIISTNNLEFKLSEMVYSETLMERIVSKKETEDFILNNENIRNAVLNSEVAMSKTVKINEIVTQNDITEISHNKYQTASGDIIQAKEPAVGVLDNCAWKAFDGIYITGSWPPDWSVGANSEALMYEFSQPILAYKFKYQISAATSGSYYRKFCVQASNDGTNWTDIAEEHEMDTYRAINTYEDIPIYNTSNLQKYKMFRIYTKEASGSIECTEIGEFEIYGIR